MTASLALYFKKEAKRDKSKEFDLKEDEIKKMGAKKGQERSSQRKLSKRGVGLLITLYIPLTQIVHL